MDDLKCLDCGGPKKRKIMNVRDAAVQFLRERDIMEGYVIFKNDDSIELVENLLFDFAKVVIDGINKK